MTVSAKRERAKATKPDQKTKRTTLRKSTSRYYSLINGSKQSDEFQATISPDDYCRSSLNTVRNYTIENVPRPF